MKFKLIAACLFALALPAQAQDKASTPIRVVVNAAPGGIADRVMRIIGPHLGSELGRHIIIDNKPGGEGYIGQQEVARANADGQTLLFTAGSMVAITPHLVPRTDFDPRTALTAVVPAVRLSMNLVVHPSVPASSASELIDYARANPGALNYGSAGSGTALHIAAAAFARETDVKLNHIPYKGAADALKDLLGGHVEAMFDPGLAIEHVKSGRLRLLAVAASERNPEFADVPTLAEIGVQGVDGGPYFGIFAPNGVSPELLERVGTAFSSVLTIPQVRSQLASMNLEIAPAMTSDAYASYIRAESERYGNLLPALGIRTQ